MKISIILFFILFCSVSVKAQEYFLGDSKEVVITTLNKSNCQFIKNGTVNNSAATYSVWEISATHNLAVYFDANSICNLCVEVFKNNQMLLTAIDDLNKRFTIINTDKWLSKDATINIVLERYLDNFNVVYQKINSN